LAPAIFIFVSVVPPEAQSAAVVRRKLGTVIYPCTTSDGVEGIGARCDSWEGVFRRVGDNPGLGETPRPTWLGASLRLMVTRRTSIPRRK
jgi:hypothetical protein